jgi:hypothetical protein
MSEHPSSLATVQDFSREDQKDRRWDGSPRHRRATQQQTGGGSATPHLSPSVLLIFL